MNKVTLHGRLAKDVELRYTNSGKAVASFTVAVNGYGRDAKADFIPCVAWENNAENIGKFFSKGKEILLEGRIQVRSYETDNGKRYATEVVVNTYEFCGNKSDVKQDGGFKGEPVNTDDIPF